MFGWFKKKKAVPPQPEESVWDFVRDVKKSFIFLVDNGSVEFQLKVGEPGRRPNMWAVNGDFWVKEYLTIEQARELFDSLKFLEKEEK